MGGGYFSGKEEENSDYGSYMNDLLAVLFISLLYLPRRLVP